MIRISLLAMLLASLTVTGVAEEIPELQELQSKYEKAKARIEKPLKDLQISYLLKLGDLKAAAGKIGDLDQVLAIETEQKNLKDGKTDIPGKYASVREARKTYDEVAQRIGGDISAELKRLFGAYLGQLSALQTELTRADRLEDALKVKQFVKDGAKRQENRTPSEETYLIGHWKFDGNGEDASGFGRHAALVGAEIVDGHLGSGALKTGVGMYAEVPHHPDYDLNHPFTIAVWVKLKSGFSQEHWAPVFNGSHAWRIQLGCDAMRPVFHVNSMAETMTANGRPDDLDEGKWHHLAGVFDGQSFRIYRDGVQIGKKENDRKVTINGLPHSIRFGGNSGDGGRRSFTGSIDDARIYRKALNLEEIKTLVSGSNLPGEE